MMISDAPDDILIGYGLGSCVAVCLYDPVKRIAGMLHALLPTPSRPDSGRPTKFVDLGVPLLIQAIEKAGGKRRRLRAYLCGGAQMIGDMVLGGMLNIGERNVQAARKALEAARIYTYKESTGGQHGCTVKLYVNTGKVTVKTLRGQEHELQ
ncbi:MAG: chemotaxis protein CheD [Anaerolineae bacterium]|nr:chemotaxis protein CheD [Anaerolineae bacterium]